MLRDLTRILSEDKSIKSRFLNRCGIQVFRSILGHLLYNVKPLRKGVLSAQQMHELKDNGFTLWPDFLPPDQFARLKDEALALFKNRHPKIESLVKGTNTFEVMRLADAAPQELPETRRFAESPKIREIMEMAAKGYLKNLNCQYEHLVQGTHPNGGDDPAAYMHSDYFTATFKAWLFVKDVRKEHGLFSYVKHSHKMNSYRLKWLYKESCNENIGSRVISDEEVRSSGLIEQAVELQENTLVIANTHGYHRRQPGLPGHDRISIGFNARVNPFFTYWLPKMLVRPS